MTGSMDPLVLVAVLSVLFTLSLVTAILQAATLRFVRSASRDQRLDSAIQDRDSTVDATCTECATKAREPSSRAERRDSSKIQLKNPLRELPAVTENRHLPSKTMPRLTASDPQWQWSSYANFESKHGEIEVRKRDKGEEQTDEGPFKVHYFQRAQIVLPDVVVVIVTSPLLVDILQRYLPDNEALKGQAEPKVKGRDLYVVLQSLKCHAFEARPKSSWSNHPVNDNLASSRSQSTGGKHHGAALGEGVTKELGADDGTALGVLYVKHLVRFLEKEYNDVLKRESRMRKEKQVTWDMLWTFLPNGTKVGYHCDQSEKLLCAVVAGSHYIFDERLRSWSFLVDLDVWIFDGMHYKTCTIKREIKMFLQERQFSELEVCPIEILGDPSDLDDKFLANGKRFYELTMKGSNRFMLYEGPMYQKRRQTWRDNWVLHKEKGDGRVMIDICSFASMNADYPMDKARPVPPSTQGFQGVHVTCEDPPALFERDGVPVHTTTKSENSPVSQAKISESSLIFAPAVVYGFCFKLKKWGCFTVSGFSDVVFDRDSFQELTMEPQMKSLVYNLVGQYVSAENNHMESSERVDPIPNKGEGLIVLCHGPPGTGKTLTAESIAENLGRALWAVSASELGSTPTEMETMLLNILDIAARWKVVLLLDEADMYLEKRTTQAPGKQNEMTGVFLRHLEYYRGILFLTTNRVGTFDDAFRSRISLFLYYPELGLTEKAKIWKSLLRRAKVEGVTDKFCEEMAGQDLNGREIRNVIHTTQVWAKSKAERLAVKHITDLMELLPNHKNLETGGR